MNKAILIELREKIDKCTEYEMKEIFKLLNHLHYTKNKNGIFIDMKQFDNTIIKKIETLLNYFNLNKETELKRQEEINKIKLNTVVSI